MTLDVVTEKSGLPIAATVERHSPSAELRLRIHDLPVQNAAAKAVLSV